MKELKNIEKLLINVDMVNGFVKKGAMADPYIEHIIPEHIKLMKQIREQEEAIVILRIPIRKNVESSIVIQFIVWKKQKKHNWWTN